MDLQSFFYVGQQHIFVQVKPLSSSVSHKLIATSVGRRPPKHVEFNLSIIITVEFY